VRVNSRSRTRTQQFGRSPGERGSHPATALDVRNLLRAALSPAPAPERARRFPPGTAAGSSRESSEIQIVEFRSTGKARRTLATCPIIARGACAISREIARSCGRTWPASSRDTSPGLSNSVALDGQVFASSSRPTAQTEKIARSDARVDPYQHLVSQLHIGLQTHPSLGTDL
jgi:hypothetical protein